MLYLIAFRLGRSSIKMDTLPNLPVVETFNDIFYFIIFYICFCVNLLTFCFRKYFCKKNLPKFMMVTKPKRFISIKYMNKVNSSRFLEARGIIIKNAQ